MRTWIRNIAVGLLLAGSGAIAATPAGHARLAEMFKEDQQVRQKPPIDWAVVSAQDKAHREEVLVLLRSGQVVTADDYYHAAMVFQHGESADDYRLAFSLAQISATLDPSKKPAKWLTAAAWDRILMSKNVPQWYGTQYARPAAGEPMALYPVEPSAVSDAERQALGVPTLQEARDMLVEINRPRSD